MTEHEAIEAIRKRVTKRLDLTDKLSEIEELKIPYTFAYHIVNWHLLP